MNDDNKNAIIEHQGQQLPTQIEQMFAQIVALASNPEAAPNITALGELQMKMMDYQKEQEFNTAKVNAIIEMPSIKRNGQIVIAGRNDEPDRVQGRFIKYESLQKVIDPILANHGLILTHNIDEAEKGGLTVQPILTHRNGYVEKGGKMPLPFDSSGGKNNTQGAGSSTSYGKRYTACAALNIQVEDEDNDGIGRPALQENQLPVKKQILIGDGRAAATNGMQAYEIWFKALTATQRGWLTEEPYHAENKETAQKAG